MKTILEVRDGAMDPSEGPEWIGLNYKGRWPEYSTFRDTDVEHQIANILGNAEFNVPVTFMLRRVSDEDWAVAQQRGDDLA